MVGGYAKIGAMGFSAGGQLVALAATRADAGDAAAKDPIDRAASKLDFAALVYPGTWPDLKIDADTPPMWLLCGSDDRPEVVAGITNIYLEAARSEGARGTAPLRRRAAWLRPARHAHGPGRAMAAAVRRLAESFEVRRRDPSEKHMFAALAGLGSSRRRFLSGCPSTVRSPDTRISVRIAQEARGQLTYSIERNGETVIAASALRVRLAEGDVSSVDVRAGVAAQRRPGAQAGGDQGVRSARPLQ